MGLSIDVTNIKFDDVLTRLFPTPTLPVETEAIRAAPAPLTKPEE